ncbi:MAG: right-handed parallel beta-helix repeat-containing protein, partial [Planctomycetes bacterium]|nr:right-handed parallel beta-helix repeat-containing protein [Planctomycetota bacterium]
KLTNIRYLGIKLQMNNGHKETETDIRITNNICTVEETNSPGQAGIAVGSAKPEGPAKGVYWEGVHIENNRVDRFDYGIQVNYAKKVNIQNNELVDTTYGILAVPCSGYIRDNVITTTKWSGIFCNVIKKSKVAIVDNVIKDPVHVTDGDIYKRCGIFLSGNGTVDLENNQMYRGKGQPLFGVYQGVDVTLGRYYNNRLLGPVVSNGRIVSQGNNDIHAVRN